MSYLFILCSVSESIIILNSLLLPVLILLIIITQKHSVYLPAKKSCSSWLVIVTNWAPLLLHKSTACEQFTFASWAKKQHLSLNSTHPISHFTPSANDRVLLQVFVGYFMRGYVAIRHHNIIDRHTYKVLAYIHLFNQLNYHSFLY